jgi:hypothetical protein
MPRYALPLADVLWSQVIKGEPDECWLWTGRTAPFGYGRISRKNWVKPKSIESHRATFLLTHGFLPPVVMHTCDNPPCCNPAHLRSGTHSANMLDRHAKGRSAKGETNGNSKLKASDVVAIRESSLSQRKLAAKFNVSRSTIEMILHRVTWK